MIRKGKIPKKMMIAVIRILVHQKKAKIKPMTIKGKGLRLLQQRIMIRIIKPLLQIMKLKRKIMTQHRRINRKHPVTPLKCTLTNQKQIHLKVTSKLLKNKKKLID